MGAFDVLNDMMTENNGYLTVAMADKAKVSKNTFYSFVKSQNLERVSRGIYISESTWPDYFYILSLKNNIVFSHETALYLHGMSEREPFQKTVTVKFGYNPEHLKKQNVKVFTVIDKYFDVGLTDIKTVFGNTVPVYDRERTICDIIRNKDNMDIQVFSYAIKEYMRSKGKNLPRLSGYGKLFGISKKIHTYTEVML